MSVLDIMNYVKSTPGNTNPAVIRSLVEGEQRSAIHEEVDSLKEKGVIGEVEWVPYADLFKEHFGLDEEDQFLSIEVSSLVKPFEEGEVLKVKTAYGATEGEVFTADIVGMKALVVSNFVSKDNYLEITNSKYSPGDWLLAAISYGELIGAPFSLYMIMGSIYSEGEKIEIFKRRAKAIDPMYIEDKILIKSANKEIEKIEITESFDDGIYDGIYGGISNSTLVPGQKYLINNEEKTQELVCKSLPFYNEGADSLFEYMTISVAGNLKLLSNLGLLPDIYEDTKEDFAYIGGLPWVDSGEVFNLFVATEPKILTVTEIGYGNQFNYSAFEGKIGIDKEDGSSQRIDLKYLPEGIGYSQIEPKVSWRYTGSVGDYTYVAWNNMMYYIKIADNFDLVNNMTGIKTRNIFDMESNVDISILDFRTENNDLGESCRAYRTEGYDDHPIIYLVENQFTI